MTFHSGQPIANVTTDLVGGYSNSDTQGALLVESMTIILSHGICGLVGGAEAFCGNSACSHSGALHIKPVTVTPRY